MKKFIGCIFAVLFAGSVFAQSADVITEILESPKVSIGQVCYLSAVAQGFVDDDATYAEAITALYNRRQIPEECYESLVVPMANLAFIYAQAWNVKGGLMYRITKGSPRYAFRQLKNDGIIATNIDPSKIVSGWEALSIFTNCSFKYGKITLSPADVEEDEVDYEYSENDFAGMVSDTYTNETVYENQE